MYIPKSQRELNQDEEGGRPYIHRTRPSGREETYLAVVHKIDGKRKIIKSFGRATKEHWDEAIEYMLPLIRSYEKKRAKKWLEQFG